MLFRGDTGWEGNGPSASWGASPSTLPRGVAVVWTQVLATSIRNMMKHADGTTTPSWLRVENGHTPGHSLASRGGVWLLPHARHASWVEGLCGGFEGLKVSHTFPDPRVCMLAWAGAWRLHAPNACSALLNARSQHVRHHRPARDRRQTWSSEGSWNVISWWRGTGLPCKVTGNLGHALHIYERYI